MVRGNLLRYIRLFCINVAISQGVRLFFRVIPKFDSYMGVYAILVDINDRLRSFHKDSPKSEIYVNAYI